MKTPTMQQARRRWNVHTRHVVSDYAKGQLNKGKTWKTVNIAGLNLPALVADNDTIGFAFFESEHAIFAHSFSPCDCK